MKSKKCLALTLATCILCTLGLAPVYAAQIVSPQTSSTVEIVGAATEQYSVSIPEKVVLTFDTSHNKFVCDQNFAPVVTGMVTKDVSVRIASQNPVPDAPNQFYLVNQSDPSIKSIYTLTSAEFSYTPAQFNANAQAAPSYFSQEDFAITSAGIYRDQLSYEISQTE